VHAPVQCYAGQQQLKARKAWDGVEGAPRTPQKQRARRAWWPSRSGPEIIGVGSEQRSRLISAIVTRPAANSP
jgi:hypothetical protein